MDKEEGDIPQPFKGAKPKQTRGGGKPKGKPQDHRQNPPKVQEMDDTYNYESPNNYYHNAPRPIEIELENNRCCMEVHNTSDSTVEFLHSQEMAYFDARSKGLVQINNSKHFPKDQYLHDRMTPATLSPSPLAYEKPIHPTKMPCITTHTELPIDDTNKSTPDDKYPWLDPDDARRNMTDKETLRMKLNLKDSILNEKEKEEFLT